MWCFAESANRFAVGSTQTQRDRMSVSASMLISGTHLVQNTIYIRSLCNKIALKNEKNNLYLFCKISEHLVTSKDHRLQNIYSVHNEFWCSNQAENAA